MILIVTLNPLLELRFYAGSVIAGSTHRPVPVKYQAGGKGFNVSRQLKLLGLKSFNVSLLGPHNGKKFREVIDDEKLDCTYIRTKCDTRIASVIIDESKREVTSFFGANAEITASESQELKVKLQKMIQNCEIVIFSGSSPSVETDSLFACGIEMARRYDKISVLDTYGAHLRGCLDAAPTIVHNNLDETRASLGLPLSTEAEIVDYLHQLYDKGIKQTYLTNGSNAFYAANHDFVYRVKVPAVVPFDSTGSGDCFTAGIVYGIFTDEIFMNTIKLASALGAANAEAEDVCRASRERADELSRDVTVEPIGKKMQLVDFTPTI